jgi:hypothetical protein
MGWAKERMSHAGLLEAGYTLHSITEQYPAECRFCHKTIMWYTTPKFKVQPFTAESFAPHHGDCLEYAEARKAQKKQQPDPPTAREPGDETARVYPD